MPSDSILSPNKEVFLQSGNSSQILNRFELAAVARYYSNKYNIRLYASETVINLDTLKSNNMTYIADAHRNMDLIQAQLKDEEAAGYLHTASCASHIEVFIITKKAIIKPIDWPRLDQFLRISGKFHETYKSNRAICPQSDGNSCGSLGLSYLKQLLKNEAKQLKELSISLPINSSSYFFVPAPQVLQYSQSQSYNECLYKEVNELPSRLQTVINSPETNASVKAEATTLLAQLPDFIERWNREFHIMQARRKSMDHADHHNRYLAYTSKRFSKIAHASSWEHTFPWIKDLKEQMEKNRLSLEQIIERALPQLEKICNAGELAYCINQLSQTLDCDRFFSEIFKSPHILRLFQNEYNVLHYKECLSFLIPKLRPSLETCMRHPSQIQRTLQGNTELKFVIEWMQGLNLPETEQIQYLLNYFKVLSTTLQGRRLLIDYVMKKDMDLGSIQNKEPLLFFLKEYAESLSIKDIVSYLAGIQDSTHFIEMLDKLEKLKFSKEQYAEFMIPIVSDWNSDFSKKLIKVSGIIGLLEILNEFCTEDQIKTYFKKYRDFLIPEILNQALAGENINKMAKKRIQFFYADTPFIISLYQRFFLQPANQDTKERLFKVLHYLVKCFPEEDRWSFIHTVFDTQGNNDAFYQKLFAFFPSQKVQKSRLMEGLLCEVLPGAKSIWESLDSIQMTTTPQEEVSFSSPYSLENNQTQALNKLCSLLTDYINYKSSKPNKLEFFAKENKEIPRFTRMEKIKAAAALLDRLLNMENKYVIEDLRLYYPVLSNGSLRERIEIFLNKKETILAFGKKVNTVLELIHYLSQEEDFLNLESNTVTIHMNFNLLSQ